MTGVYIGGIGMTQFGKSSKSLVQLLCEAASCALADTNADGIEAIYVAAMNPEEFTGESNLAARVAEACQMSGVPAFRIETASSAGAAALSTASHAIASRHYRRVLVLGGEKMTQLSTSATTRIVAEALDDHDRRCGATLAALAAMVIEKYRSEYRISQSRLERILCALAMKNHLNGSLNPYAQFRSSISKEQYLSSKFVATPLRLYDCAPITDGAAAVVLTCEPTDIHLSGLGQATAPVSLRLRDSLTSFTATRTAAKRAYLMAGCTPQAIDFAEVHDAFTPFEIIASEDLGFFSAGKGGNAVESGQTRVDGVLPINPSGGLKARGHPIGASGVAQVCESVRLLRGASAAKLKREPKRGLTQSTGAFANNNFVIILEKTTARAVAGMTADRRPKTGDGRSAESGALSAERKERTEREKLGNNRMTGEARSAKREAQSDRTARNGETEEAPWYRRPGGTAGGEGGGRSAEGGALSAERKERNGREQPGTNGMTGDRGPTTDETRTTAEFKKAEGGAQRAERGEWSAEGKRDDRRPTTNDRKTGNQKPETIPKNGKIETFTVLHTTAEGFAAPIVLALIRDNNGSLIMARGEDAADLKTGREVVLREIEGIYFFRVKSYLRQVRDAMRQLLVRAAG